MGSTRWLFVCGCLAACSADVKINTDLDAISILHVADERYLSIALDCSLIKYHWKTFNASDPKVITLAKGLSPAILRLGGTACDYTVFNSTMDDVVTKPFLAEKPTKYSLDDAQFGSILRIQDWDNLVGLANLANLSLLFDANVMLRDKDKNWDSSNFKEFLKYNQAKGTRGLMFELGNEPNNYPAHFNLTITAAQLAKDFSVMRTLVESNPYYKGSTIVGADVGNPYIHGLALDPATYIQDFFQAGHKYIDALTWHQYYLKGSTAKLEDFINPAVMEIYKEQVDIVASIISKVVGNKSFPVWMGETSSAYNSGAQNMSNVYVAGFLWMDKLGVAAVNGYDIVIRQTFYDGWYSLIDHQLNPQPDYWLSALYKKLVGARVLNITQSGEITQSKYVRLYAHCTSPRAGYTPGSVTVYAMNLYNVTSVTISLPLKYDTVYSYSLEPPGGNLQSPVVNLNGKPLHLTDSHQLPPLDPVKTSAISLKPLTFGLFVVEAGLAVCV